jgi:hypothetical protein
MECSSRLVRIGPGLTRLQDATPAIRTRHQGALAALSSATCRMDLYQRQWRRRINEIERKEKGCKLI